MAAPISMMDDVVLVRFAQKLAGNEKKQRDISLKKFRKWLTTKSTSPSGALTHGELMKIWKGLHYCMWMADKPLVQEELCDSLSSLIHVMGSAEAGLLFFQVFMETEAREWYGTDRLRLDKFMMLIRRVLRQVFTMLGRYGWAQEHTSQLLDILSPGLMSGTADTVPDGLKTHVADIYLEELTLVAAEQLSSEQVVQLVRPYIQFAGSCMAQPLRRTIIKRVFFPLIDSAAQRLEDDEGEEPVQSLPVDCSCMAKELMEVAVRSKGGCRKDLYSLVKTFQDLAAGVLPAEDTVSSDEDDEELRIQQAVVRLTKFEKSVSTAKQFKEGEKRKKRKLEEADGERPAKKKKKRESVDSDTTSPSPGKKAKNKYTATEKNKRKDKLLQVLKAKEEQVAAQQSAEGGEADESDHTSLTPPAESTSHPHVAPCPSPNGDLNNHELIADDFTKLKAKAPKAIKTSPKSPKLSKLGNSSKKSEKKKKRDSMSAVCGEAIFEGGFVNSDDEGVTSSPVTLSAVTSSVTPSPVTSSSVTPSSVTSSPVTSSSVTPSDVMSSAMTPSAAQDTSADGEAVTAGPDGPAELKTKKKRRVEVVSGVGDGEMKELMALVVKTMSKKSLKKSEKSKKRRKSLESAQVSDSAIRVVKKKKRKSVDNVNSAVLLAPLLNGLASEVPESSMDFTSTVDKSLSETNENESNSEVEIFIPNKKYAGPLKDAFQKLADKKAKRAEKFAQAFVRRALVKCSTPQPASHKPAKAGCEFAQFDGAPVPAAFVRRAVVKCSTPQPASHKPAVQTLSAMSDPGQKRVKIVLSNNTAQEFADSLTVSPKAPFNPKLLPEIGILKQSPLTQPITIALKGKKKSPVIVTPKKKLFSKKLKGIGKKSKGVKRARASDFF